MGTTEDRSLQSLPLDMNPEIGRTDGSDKENTDTTEEYILSIATSPV